MINNNNDFSSMFAPFPFISVFPFICTKISLLNPIQPPAGPYTRLHNRVLYRFVFGFRVDRLSYSLLFRSVCQQIFESYFAKLFLVVVTTTTITNLNIGLMIVCISRVIIDFLRGNKQFIYIYMYMWYVSQMWNIWCV